VVRPAARASRSTADANVRVASSSTLYPDTWT
jgi:hypothetical protein